MKRLMYIVLLATVLPLLILVPTGCVEKEFADEDEVLLTFSSDTVSFDTVFTTVGTATRQVLVYNRSRQNVVISTVTLQKGSASRFRLNVDGDTSLVARDIELLAGDSIFIFIQANIKPNDQTSPFIEEDAIVFGNGQRLPLTAWGRNAVYHQPTDTLFFSSGSFMLCSILDCANWDHTRPHILMGTAVVLDGSTLNLQAGDELYFANDAILMFDTNARLVATGTAEQPVLFSSLRHDGWYSFLPGQWQCVLFTGGSTGNSIDHAVVENGTGGLRAYPGAEFTISNSIIRNMSDCALIGQGGGITGNNLLVYDCLSSFTALRGGNYGFTGCTFADYWRYSARRIESVVLTNYILNADGSVREAGDLEQAAFTDCIIYGNYSPAEVLASGIDGYQLNYSFNHCLVKGGEWDEDPLFVDVEEDDYHLQEDSPAQGIGFDFDN